MNPDEANNVNYFLIAPATKAYQGREYLTYHSEKMLALGQLVDIKIRGKNYMGVVMKKVSKPTFNTTKTEIINNTLILPKSHLQLLEWMRNYYPGSVGSITLHFAPSFLSKIKNDKNQENTTSERFSLPKLPLLTSEQKNVLANVSDGSQLLHGETGSGKTRIYVELAKQALQQRKSAVILTPEISLSAPLQKYFEEIFSKDKVIISHSNLTQKQREAVWKRILFSNEPLVIIGPRSALFLPLANIGLIVIDESHDQAYKQESAPYYSALRIASKLASIHNSRLLFGSATPAISEYFLANQKKILIHRMKHPAIKNSLQKTAPLIVDLTDENEFSGAPLLSKTLLSQIQKSLEQKTQSLLFLNKRGSSRTILCQSCGWKSMCPRCDVTLTYHQDNHTQQCHVCGYSENPPSKCPDCNSVEIIFKNPGTKAIQGQLAKLFPGAKIARFDRDNKKSERIEENYSKVKSGEIDILIGTQILSKGHDLPNLRLVAMLSAESSLAFPDYLAEEQTFQLIKQLSGRINRGHQAGLFILQTYNPKNPLFNQVLKGEWIDFYSSQLEHRKSFSFPPFVHALKLEAISAKATTSKTKLERVLNNFGLAKTSIFGPAPCFIEKRNGKYHWQVIITSKHRADLVEIANSVGGTLKAEMDPLHFL